MLGNFIGEADEHQDNAAIFDKIGKHCEERQKNVHRVPEGVFGYAMAEENALEFKGQKLVMLVVWTTTTEYCQRITSMLAKGKGIVTSG